MIKRVLFIIILITSSHLTHYLFASSFEFYKDSIGIERRNNRVYILHKVEAKETVKAIAKQYNVSEAVIQMVNSLQDSKLLIGQIIRIPLVHRTYTESLVLKDKRIYTVKEGDNLYRIARDFSMDITRLRNLNKLRNDFISEGQKIVVEVAIGETEQEEPQEFASAEGEKIADSDDESYPAWVFEPAKLIRVPVMHTVSPKETLYKISEDRKISLDSIRIWNNLTQESIDVGDLLIVGYQVKETQAITAENEAELLKVEELRKPTRLPEYRPEKGIGAIIPDGENDKPSTQKLALHATARVGAYVKVRNPNNNRSVLVKVVGRLSPADVEKKIIIKMNTTACKSVGLVNEKFPIEVIYNN